MRSSSFSLVGAVCAALFLVVCSTNAVPYASGVTGNAGIVSFILNEAADNVTVIFDHGASSQDLGPLDKGTHSFPIGSAISFEIVVRKSAGSVWTLISTDTNRLMQFNSGRGVAVNLQASTPAFGRIYVANSSAGTATGRPVGDGIYVLNADQTDALGRGDAASTAGLTFTTGGQQANTPWHIEVGADNHLYIADFSTNAGTIYRTDPDVTSGSGEVVLAGPGATNNPSVHTTIGSSPIVLGSLATSDLTIYAIDGAFPGNFNRLFRWDIGAGPLPHNAPPTGAAPAGLLIGSVANITTDFDRGPDGKLFLMQNRSAGNESGVIVVDTDGTTVLWRSLAESRVVLGDPSAVDILRQSRAVKISPDGQRMAVIRDDLQTWIIPLTNGVPDLLQREVVQTHSGNPTTLGRDVCFDAAGNLYALSSGNLLLRIFSPGGRTTATTGSDGTFTLVTVPVPSVRLAATDNQGAEEGADAIAFTLTRNEVNVDQPLTVFYTLTGLAANGADYPLDPLSVTFPANQTNATITLTPIDDSEAEVTEDVALTIASNSEYGALNPTTATATILDNEPLTLRLTGTTKTNMYEPLPTDTVTLRVTRLGSLAGDVFGAELLSSGVATETGDYVLSTNYFPIAPGEVTVLVTVAPLNDSLLEGDETGVVALGGGSGEYLIDAQNSVTILVRDDELPPAPILFAEDFTTDASANWQTRFGANDGANDFAVNWQYDYGPLGIGPAPKTEDGSTVGLFAAVNIANPAVSAGINFYPNGQSFSGDYALRFDMYLSYGATVTTEHALAGVNHSGNVVNRATQSPDPNNTTAGGDGFWVGIVSDASNLRDYSAYMYPTPTSLPTVVINREASTLTGQITSPPYFLAGSPGSSGSRRSWSEVELMQVSDVITLKVNNIEIWQYQNTNGPTGGNIMIGLNDQFDSVGTALHYVVFDNVRVVSLSTGIEITGVELLAGNQIQIDFTSATGGAASEYVLQKKDSLTAANWDDHAAAITSLGGTQYRAIATRAGGERYYRVSKP